MREFVSRARLGGCALLRFDIGDEVIHRNEWWRSRSRSTSTSYQLETLARRLEEAGFRIEAKIERAPYVGSVEHP